MDRSSVVYLVSNNSTQDEFGVWHTNPTQRKVFCEVSSISQNEWFEGGRQGLNPQFRVRMFRYDYKGESSLIYDGVEYSIYRTYIDKNEIIDLYLELRKGNG